MSNKLKNTLIITSFSFLGILGSLTACLKTADIKNQTLRDRVCACSAGFSNDVSAGLQLAYDKTTLKGGVLADLKSESQSVIFSQLPEQDRLKAYEDYIRCIENNLQLR